MIRKHILLLVGMCEWIQVGDFKSDVLNWMKTKLDIVLK